MSASDNHSADHQPNQDQLLAWDDEAAERLNLPVARDAVRAHGAEVKRHLLHKIAKNPNTGLLFEDFMSTCLYAPSLGYYASGLDIFTDTGDFITAPTLGSLFAIGLANAFAPLLPRFSHQLVEFGAGNGDLAIKLLSALQQKETLPTHYHIIELSPSLAARQKARIEASLAEQGITTQVSWHQSLETVPKVAIVFANEVLDAMPHARFEIKHKQNQAVVVNANENQFTYTLTSRRAGVSAALYKPWENYWAEDNHVFDEGLQSEYSPYLPGWLEALKRHFDRSFIYLIDYGEVASQFYLPERQNGTMICHYRHRAHDEMRLYPGLQDISASVEFSAVAHFGYEAGLELVGFTTQAAFLMDNGILAEVASQQNQLVNQSTPTNIKPAEFQLLQETKRLLMPGEMGERFKVMCFSIDADDALEDCQGFDRVELSELL